MSLIIFFGAIFLIYFIGAGHLALFCFRRGKKIWAGLLTLSILVLFYSALIEPYWVKVREQKIEINKLNEEITVVLVSDWHIRPGKRAGFIKKMAQKIARQKPDLILLAGDYFFFDEFEKFSQDLAVLGELAKIAPTFAALGNHDHGLGNRDGSVRLPDQHLEISQTLKENGISVLPDVKEKVKIKDMKVWVVGFDEFWFPDKKPAQAVAGLENDGLLKIGLSHNPDAALQPEAKILDLVLAGHTHGGQIRLPWFGALAEVETDFPRADYGRYLADHQPKIFNTVGIGESGPFLRFWNRPEIVVLKIK